MNRISPEQARELVQRTARHAETPRERAMSAKAMKDVGQAPAGEPKPGKYHNIRTVVDGINFASKREANYYSELLAMQRMGTVSWFMRQPIFDLGGGTTYRADFLVVMTGGAIHVVDVKPAGTYRLREYIFKKKIVESRYPVRIQEP